MIRYGEKQVGFRLPAHMAKSLDDLAARECVPKSYLIRRAVQLLLTQAETTNRPVAPAGYRWSRDDDPAP